MKGEDDVFAFTTGPRTAKIILVGEAWGEQEAEKRLPFQGYSGQELDRILQDGGLSRSQILCTNVVSSRPPGNDFTKFLHPTADKAVPLYRGVYPQQLVTQGVERMDNLIQSVRPQLIIAAGNWPLWALSEHYSISSQGGFRLPAGITTHRGSQTFTRPINGLSYPLLPIIHPAAINRNWSLRHTTCQDLRARAARFINGQAPWTPPTYDFIADGSFRRAADQLRGWLSKADGSRSEPLSLCCDVETYQRRHLTVIGISDGSVSLAVPFFYFAGDRQVDVFTLEEERILVGLIRRLLLHPLVSVLNQNCAYDYFMLRHVLGLEVPFSFDTMLAHHTLFPGTPKALQNLAAQYCEHYTYWKDESQDWTGTSDPKQYWEYNCKDTIFTWEIARELKSLVISEKQEEQFAFQMEQFHLSMDMTNFGVNWDHANQRRYKQELEAEARRCEAWLARCMPDDIAFAPTTGTPWYDSAKWQQTILYEYLGIEPVRHKKTKQATVNKESFEVLKKRAPWLSTIFDTIEYLRSINVFIRNFLSAEVGNDQRMHSSFNVGGTSTFRWSSSSNPLDQGLNLQNMPRLEED